MAFLQVYALGRLRVLYDDTPLRFSSKRSLDLLCFLLLHPGETMERGLIAERLWPVCPPGKSRRSLATALWRLRQSLPAVDDPGNDFLLSERNSVAFNQAAPYWFDVEVFEQQAAFGLQGTFPLDSAHLKALETALDLYRGDLLEDCYDDWCLVERERLQLLLLRVVKRLQRHYRLSGVYEAAVSCGRQLLAMDPLQEDVHRELMRCYMAAGQRPLALAQFEECRKILNQDLRIEPMPETWRLYRRIRSAVEIAPTPAATDGSSGVLREALAQLRHALDTLESTWQSLHLLAADFPEERKPPTPRLLRSQQG